MRRIKLTLQYEGSRYSGWQKQAGTLTLQETLEKALSQITGESVAVQGASRTDAGVHALGQVAHFDDSGTFPLAKYPEALNALLPEDFSVLAAEEVSPQFHARFDAESKWYQYRLLNRREKAVFARRHVYQIEVPLNLAKMRRAAQHLIGTHDFTSFKTQSSQNGEQDPVRKITKIQIRSKGDEIFMDVEGTGFLYKMVRGMVGSLIEVGRGRFNPDWMAEALSRCDRTAAGPNAPAHGLFLMQVKYGLQKES